MAQTITVDARGRSCPEPVLMTKRAAEKAGAGTMEVLVDTATSKENVTRYAEGAGWKVSAAPNDGGFKLTLKK